MLSAEAMRLAAVEVLCPTASLTSGVFPTLAGSAVLDSRAVALQDLDESRVYTPVLALHTRSSEAALRGQGAAVDDTDAHAILEVVAELAVVAQDESGGAYADAMAGGDADARLVLAALAAQVRWLLTQAEAGRLFRRVVKAVERIDEETFGVPELGIRWQRVTLRFHCHISDDDFSDAPGLPEPLATIAAALPANSYAKAKLERLATHFLGQTRDGLDTVTFTDPDTGAGMTFPIP